MVGSLFGIVLANKTQLVKTTYSAIAMKIQLAKGPIFNTSQDENQKTEKKDDEDSIQFEENAAPVEKDENSLNLKTVKNILMWWAATVPVALLVSYAITSLLLINQPPRVDICP